MTLWRTRSSTTVYENPWIRVREDAVDRPDGSAGIYGVVEVRNAAVFVVPVTADDEVVLVEVDRYTTGASARGPRGWLRRRGPAASPRERELREETGLVADSWEHVGSMFALNGICHAPEHVYLARGLRPSDEPTEHAVEGITEVRTVPWARRADDGRGRHDHRRRDRRGADVRGDRPAPDRLTRVVRPSR